MDKPIVKKGFATMFDLSQQAANLWFGVFNVALIVGAAIVLIGTWGVIWTGGIRERYSDERMNRNELETAKANDSAARANLEAEIVKANIAWRRLNKKQYDILVSELRGKSITVWTAFNMDDPESTRFRSDIDAALQAAGAKTKFFGGVSPINVGLFLTTVPGPEHDALVSAFKKADIKILDMNPFQHTLNELAIVIGSKPPAY